MVGANARSERPPPFFAPTLDGNRRFAPGVAERLWLQFALRYGASDRRVYQLWCTRQGSDLVYEIGVCDGRGAAEAPMLILEVGDRPTSPSHHDDRTFLVLEPHRGLLSGVPIEVPASEVTRVVYFAAPGGR